MPTATKMTFRQAGAALELLEGCIQEVKAIDPTTIRAFGVQAQTLVLRVNGAIADVFGVDALEYRRAAVIVAFFTAPPNRSNKRADRVQAFVNGQHLVIRKLETELDLLKELIKATGTYEVRGGA